MNWKKVFAIVRREYIERVRTKAFWIGTALIPIFFFGYIGIQIVSSRKAGGDRRLAVVDVTGGLYEPLVTDLKDREQKNAAEPGHDRGVHWVVQQVPVTGSLEATKETLRKDVLAKKIDGYLILDLEQLEKERVEYYTTAVSEFVAMNQLERSVNHVLLKERIAKRGLPPELAAQLEKRVDLKPFKITKEGATEEKGASFFAVLIFTVILYSTFIMYGMQNMKGVIDEKTNRIVEVVIASVRPTELMLGKIVGIGLVGLTQYLIWSLVAMNLSLPAIAGMMSTTDMGVPKIPMSMILYFVLFFLFGYFLYASIYTAIGAPFNTDQEAQQLAMIPMMFIISVWAFFPVLLNNANGGLAVFVSLFPFTAPLAMFMRTAMGQPPVWQVALSLVIIALTTFGIAWLAGRIYRVGILMYGKKPTIPEIVRWIRYKPGQAPQPAAGEAT
ncbi:MAG TPA: ABC transporter permease [Thermoanaerobaculia bacterium]|nr:ABC transporter permease [Thermoanaerobaculia bacterium]